jgi:putative transposase
MARPSRYPDEFRRDAVQMALASKTSWAAVARRLGVKETTLRNWVHAHLAEQERAANPLWLKESEFEELRRLRREVKELKVEEEILREAASFFGAGDDPVCRFRFVAEYRGLYGVKRLCRVVRVSRSGVYAQAKRAVPQRASADERLATTISEIYTRSRRTYGSPRVHAELARQGVRCSRKRVARLMKSRALVGVHARRRWRRAKPGVGVFAPDLVRRNFNPAGQDQPWAADVTQFRTGEGWLHLAIVMDLWSRRVIGWSTGTAPNAELVSHALVLAAMRRHPRKRVVHHSHRGAAYTSIAFSQRVVELELDQSLGRTGDCYDCRRRSVLRHPEARTRVDLPAEDLAHPGCSHRRVDRLHRGLLQPTTNPRTTRLPQPHRV